MVGIRRRLSWIAGAWLICQAGVLTAAPLSLSGLLAPVSTNAILCTCASDTDHDCPMHGKHQHHESTGTPDCALRSASDATDVTLVSLFAGIGLIPPALMTSVTLPESDSVSSLSGRPLPREVRPESPPPRLF
jgi:hypothetical protein